MTAVVLVICAALVGALCVLVTRQVAAAVLRRVVDNASDAYVQSCGALPENAEAAAAGYAGLETAEREAVFRSALLLVRLVDALYLAKDARADDWAICIDDYSGILNDSGAQLERYALHPETRAALGEAMAFSGQAQAGTWRPPQAIGWSEPAPLALSRFQLTGLITLAAVLGVIAGAAAFAVGFAGTGSNVGPSLHGRL